MPVGVVTPLNAVYKGSTVDHQRAFAVHREEDQQDTREEEDIVSSRAVSDTPQKRDCRLPPEQANS